MLSGFDNFQLIFDVDYLKICSGNANHNIESKYKKKYVQFHRLHYAHTNKARRLEKFLDGHMSRLMNLECAGNKGRMLTGQRQNANKHSQCCMIDADETERLRWRCYLLWESCQRHAHWWRKCISTNLCDFCILVLMWTMSAVRCSLSECCRRVKSIRMKNLRIKLYWM